MLTFVVYYSLIYYNIWCSYMGSMNVAWTLVGPIVLLKIMQRSCYYHSDWASAKWSHPLSRQYLHHHYYRHHQGGTIRGHPLCVSPASTWLAELWALVRINRQRSPLLDWWFSSLRVKSHSNLHRSLLCQTFLFASRLQNDLFHHLQLRSFSFQSDYSQ